MTSTDEGLANYVLPARGAAQKATASIAEQLTGSPDRSDVSSCYPFREPAHRTKSVKYRYTATGKHLSSPLKGSSSSPERKTDKPKKSTLATLIPAPSSHAPKGKAQAVATTSRKRKASVAPLRKEDLLNSMFVSSPSPLSSVPSSPTAPTKDLPSSPTLTAKVSIPHPPKRLTVSKTLSFRSFEPEVSVLPQPLSPKRKQKKNRARAQKSAHAWDIGDSVWVRVTQSGVLADNNAQLKADLWLSEPFMWWPAQVVQKRPLRVSMFGDFPSSSSTSRGLCTVFEPSSSNVQSVNDDSGTNRFSRATFLTSLTADDDVGPPTKKPRLDDIPAIEARWESAVQSMEKASTLERDGLPALISSYATAGGSFYDSLDDSDLDTSGLRQLQKPTASASKKSKQTESTKKSNPQHGPRESTTRRDRSPCFADPTLQIPGELILALAPKTGGAYWPAKILEYAPGGKEKYKVRFLDDEEHVIARNKFWTSEEAGFVQCTLGEWESAIKTVDDPESGDEGGEFGTDDTNAQDLDDSTLPPPPPAEDFEDLSVRAQLAYVKPVLRAILNKGYEPAREKHDAFINGGSGRAALLKSAGVRGGMDARFVKAVQKVICEWVLGDSGFKPEQLDAGDTAAGGGEADRGATGEAAPADARPVEVSPRDSVPDDKMEGIEGLDMPEDAHAKKKDDEAGRAIPLTTPDKQAEIPQVAEMAVDAHQQDPVSLHLSSNGITLSPAVKQATLTVAPKSQLDLLAEVSQAVATEPSLLPSHPELPRLKTLFDMTRKDTSPQPSPLTPVPGEGQPLRSRRSLPVAREEFEALSGVEKLDYCLNILLPESIQQLLLWRSGERTSSALLSPEEEQRLHDVAIRKAAETDWVDDVMRLRAAQARLWGIDLNKKKAEEMNPEVLQGGTRSRPRRATVSRP